MTGTPAQIRCEMCHEPVHMVNGVLVHDFTSSEKCTLQIPSLSIE